jgi:hypothetical protein
VNTSLRSAEGREPTYVLEPADAFLLLDRAPRRIDLPFQGGAPLNLFQVQNFTVAKPSGNLSVVNARPVCIRNRPTSSQPLMTPQVRPTGPARSRRSETPVVLWSARNGRPDPLSGNWPPQMRVDPGSHSPLVVGRIQFSARVEETAECKGTLAPEVHLLIGA